METRESPIDGGVGVGVGGEEGGLGWGVGGRGVEGESAVVGVVGGLLGEGFI